jgi:AcrR family transcriptional regulator
VDSNDHRDPVGLRILEASIDLMRAGGTQAVTTEAVASQASVSKASIYRRWPSRSHLLAAAAAHAFPEIDVPDLGNVLDEVRHFLEGRVVQYSEPGASRLVASLIGASISDEKVNTFFREWISGQMLSSKSVFERATARGEFSPEWRVEDLRTIMSAPIMFRAVAENQAPDQELVECILRVLGSAMTRA